ncbi:MAG TPA: YqgE/AlgH family protein [Myxococcota bacterium]|nr:YqgE/AlgH family protein [Myxococcota bacterium]
MDGNTLAPCLLVAMPQLLDPNFRRSVVLIVHHDETGTFGLVLNRISDVSVGDLCGTLGIEWHGGEVAHLAWGGPVQPNTGWLLLGELPLGAGSTEDGEEVTEIDPGLHFAGSLATLRRVADAPPGQFRLFLGYAGWGPGQLESELAQGAWLVAPLRAEVVFDSPDEMWEGVVRSLGVDPSTLVSTPGVH